MVVYKYDNILHYFDPQSNRLTTDASDILGNKDLIIIDYGLFNTNNVEKTMDLVDNTCKLDYINGGKNK